jgi:hypothetical protein
MCAPRPQYEQSVFYVLIQCNFHFCFSVGSKYKLQTFSSVCMRQIPGDHWAAGHVVPSLLPDAQAALPGLSHQRPHHSPLQGLL